MENLLLKPLTGGTRSRVQADAQHKLIVGTMSYLETRHFVDQIESHVAYFNYVLISIDFRQTADYHVRIANRLHLKG